MSRIGARAVSKYSTISVPSQYHLSTISVPAARVHAPRPRVAGVLHVVRRVLERAGLVAELVLVAGGVVVRALVGDRVVREGALPTAEDGDARAAVLVVVDLR